MTYPRIARRPALLLAVALLLAALATVLLRPASTLAKDSHSVSCTSAAASGHHAHACATRKHATHAQAKGKPHRAKHHLIKKNKKAKKHRAGTHTAASAQTPAVCEDGTTPTHDTDGAFSCGDGSEAACTGGAKPVPSKSGAKLLCPAARSSTTEWSEATCEDGGAPVHGSTGYTCTDGSAPECEDGSRPTASDDGAMLVCLSHGASGSPTRAEEKEEESEEALG